MRSVGAEEGSTLGDAVIATGLSLEQPCAGRGTCLKCKVMAEGALTPLDEHELAGLSSAERAAHYRLACRARVTGDVAVTLAPIVVYSNKIFRASDDHRRAGVPLGLAIDLGSTTVAAFVTTLDEGKVCAGAAALNQQTAFGADVISRLAAAQNGRIPPSGVSVLAFSSIVQAVDALKLAPASGRASARSPSSATARCTTCCCAIRSTPWPRFRFSPTAPRRFVSLRSGATTRQSVGGVATRPNPFAEISRPRPR